jgi:hypothetical protein
MKFSRIDGSRNNIHRYKGTRTFPLLHFLLPPGEENRGRGLP